MGTSTIVTSTNLPFRVAIIIFTQCFINAVCQSLVCEATDRTLNFSLRSVLALYGCLPGTSFYRHTLITSVYKTYRRMSGRIKDMTFSFRVHFSRFMCRSHRVGCLKLHIGSFVRSTKALLTFITLSYFP
jgi:hypothetical protein